MSSLEDKMNKMYNEDHDPATHVDKTIQMETDTTTIEREILLQAAIKAVASSNQHDIKAAQAQIQEHMKMYEADQGMSALQEQLTNLSAALGEETPDRLKYAERAGK